MAYLLTTTFIWAFSFSLIGHYLSPIIDSWSLSFFRTLIALLVFIPFIDFKISRKHILFMILIGAIQIGIMYLMYLNAFKFTSVSKILLFTITTPLYVTFIADLIEKKFRSFFLMLSIASIVGASFLRFNSPAQNDLIGFFLIQGANFCFALGQVLYKFFEKWTGRIPNGMSDFAYFYIGALIFTTVGFLSSDVKTPLPNDIATWLLIVWMGGFKIGALSMQTKEVKNIANAENYGVYRIRKELPNRTNFGALITSKNDLNSSANNKAYALDGAYGIGETIQLKGFLATSDLPADSDNNGDSYAYMLEANRNTQALTTQLRYSEVGKNFNPEMGYVRRLGYRKILFRILNRTRPKDFYGILELRPHITYWSYWDFDGFQQSGYLHIDNHWEFRNGYRIDTAVNFIWEGVKNPFEIVNGVTVPNNSYANSELHTRFNSNLTKPISLIVVSKIGGFFSGNRRNTDTTFRFRLGERFTSEIISKYNDVSLPEGKFYTHLLRSRFTYAFNPQMYIQSLLQYNNQSDQWSMNWRFIWQQSAATGLYIVYNQTQDYDGIPTDLNIRSLVFKYSYLFDID